MSGLLTKVATVVLSAAVSLTSFAPAGALEMPRIVAAPANGVIAVRDDTGNWGNDRVFPRPGRYYDRGVRVYNGGGFYRNNGFYGDGFYGDGYYRNGGGYYRNDGGYYRGGFYNGYRYHRPGYRYHEGFWFPFAAFAAGAIIGGALADRPAYGGYYRPSHVSWCQNRYRSYRAYDNTFQPYYGPRQQCISPY